MIGIGAHGTTLEIARLTRWRKESWVARGLGALALLSVIGLMFAPWQQNAVGAGQVIAFSPNERELEIQAPIKGRVVKWHFQEGDQVEEGEVIVELADNDPNVVQRYVKQRAAVMRRIAATERSVGALVERIESLVRVRRLTLESAEAKVRMAMSKARAEELKLEAAQAKQRAAEIQVERVEALAEEGLESQREYELAVRNVAEARAGTLEADARVQAARADVAAARATRESKGSELDAKLAEAKDKLEEGRSKLAKAEEEIEKVERALARQSSLEIRAPRDGMLTHVRARENSAFVKPGEILAIVIPNTYRRAVELMVSGLDAPLVVPGQEVQLQFEGWPAIQFGGWPEAAVGTFRGEVAFVDAKANPKGEFRAVVIPAGDDEWPSPDVLRQGNLVNGWVLLNQVPLGYELWRQLNGFPADLPDKAAQVSGIGVKKVKPD